MFDYIVPTGEAIIGRSQLVEHITDGNARFDERVNLVMKPYGSPKTEVSGFLRSGVDNESVYVETKDEEYEIFSPLYNNLTPHEFVGFRYQNKK